MNLDHLEQEHCSRCATSLERGYSLRYRGEELVEALCFRCNDEDHIVAYEKTSIITTTVLMMAASDDGLRRHGVASPGVHSSALTAIWHSHQRINQEIKELEQDVWFGGLQKLIRESPARGFKMTFGNVKALAYVIAGRAAITVENDDAFVSVLTDESSTEACMGIHGIRATQAQAIGFLSSCRGAFLLGAKFERDDNVGIGL